MYQEVSFQVKKPSELKVPWLTSNISPPINLQSILQPLNVMIENIRKTPRDSNDEKC